jgi:hypothetical protein
LGTGRSTSVTLDHAVVEEDVRELEAVRAMLEGKHGTSEESP